jgi:ABC-type amino acid transport substrate-binding protein
MQMLLTDNRQIDYYFDSREQIIQTAQQLNINIDNEGLFFKSFSKAPLYMIFSNTPKGKALKLIFDRGVEQLFCQGKLNTIYKKWHKNPPKIYISCKR